MFSRKKLGKGVFLFLNILYKIKDKSKVVYYYHRRSLGLSIVKRKVRVMFERLEPKPLGIDILEKESLCVKSDKWKLLWFLDNGTTKLGYRVFPSEEAALVRLDELESIAKTARVLYLELSASKRRHFIHKDSRKPELGKKETGLPIHTFAIPMPVK